MKEKNRGAKKTVTTSNSEGGLKLKKKINEGVLCNVEHTCTHKKKKIKIYLHYSEKWQRNIYQGDHLWFF